VRRDVEGTNDAAAGSGSGVWLLDCLWGRRSVI